MLAFLDDLVERVKADLVSRGREIFSKYFQYKGKIERLRKRIDVEKLSTVAFTSKCPPSVSIGLDYPGDKTFYTETIPILEDVYGGLYYIKSLFKGDEEILSGAQELEEILTRVLMDPERADGKVCRRLKLKLKRFSTMLSLKLSDYIRKIAGSEKPGADVARIAIDVEEFVDFVKRKGRVSLDELSKRFYLTHEQVEAVLRRLMKMGKIRGVFTKP
jgi:hypothetical protein